VRNALHRAKLDTVPVTSGRTDAAALSGFTAVLGAPSIIRAIEHTSEGLLGSMSGVAEPVALGPYLLACRAQGEHVWLDSYAIARTLGVLMMDSSYFFHQHGCWMGFRVNLSSRPEHIGEAIARVFPLEPPSEDMPGYAGPCRERSCPPQPK
jgi:hypothetical protein